MFTILLHSSKTMREPSGKRNKARFEPALIKEARVLMNYLTSLSPKQLKGAMGVSDSMADKVYEQVAQWNASNASLPTIDAFLGDIYSGLQVHAFSDADREYAQQHLYILSGLYGVLRALDEIQPYRLEMGYKLPGNKHDKAQPDITNMYAFWGDAIARQLPQDQTIINLSAVEYTKAVFPHFKSLDAQKATRIITPKFLTISPKTGEPTFVTVHAKVARGAFARWLIQNQVERLEQLKDFREIGYAYAPQLSTENEPVFVAKEFQGIGLSVRLTGKK